MIHQVVSPVPGVFYRRPSPDDEAFVEVGSVVGAESVVALVEVMKTFFEVLAGESGRVITIEVGDSAMVNAGDVVVTVAMLDAVDEEESG